MKIDTSKCNNWKSDGRMGYRCHRPATGDDGLCNICRAAKKRGDAKRKASDDAFSAKREREAAIRNRVQRLADETGVDVEPYYRWSSGKYLDNKVVVPLDWFIKVTEALERIASNAVMSDVESYMRLPDIAMQALAGEKVEP